MNPLLIYVSYSNGIFYGRLTKTIYSLAYLFNELFELILTSQSMSLLKIYFGYYDFFTAIFILKYVLNLHVCFFFLHKCWNIKSFLFDKHRKWRRLKWQGSWKNGNDFISKIDLICKCAYNAIYSFIFFVFRFSLSSGLFASMSFPIITKSSL